MKNKYLSRKFIVTVISAVAGIVVAIIGHDEIVQSIAACLAVVIPTVVYTITEGRIDAAGIKSSGEAVEKLLLNNGKKSAAEVVRNLTDIAESIAEDPPDEEAPEK